MHKSCAYKNAFAPKMACTEELAPGYLADELESDKIVRRKKDLSQVYMTGGRLPQGVTINEVEKQFKPLKKQLGKLFKQWELKKVSVILNIEKGLVKVIQITQYEGKECKKEILEKILKKMSFDISISGKMELELICL